MFEEALLCLREADSFAAIEFLNQQPQATAVAAAYHDLVNVLYWQERHIPWVIAISRAGIQYCFDQAEKTGLDDWPRYLALRSAGKQLAYNLASYTWPGWNEPDLSLSALAQQAGLDAARLNLRLALELDQGDLALSRAYWMLAAHLLTRSAFHGAEATFRRAALYAERAESRSEQQLALAFAALAAWCREPQREARRRSFEAAQNQLQAEEESAALVSQLDQARAALGV